MVQRRPAPLWPAWNTPRRPASACCGSAGSMRSRTSEHSCQPEPPPAGPASACSRVALRRARPSVDMRPQRPVGRVPSLDGQLLVEQPREPLQPLELALQPNPQHPRPSAPERTPRTERQTQWRRHRCSALQRRGRGRDPLLRRVAQKSQREVNRRRRHQPPAGQAGAACRADSVERCDDLALRHCRQVRCDEQAKWSRHTASLCAPLMAERSLRTDWTLGSARLTCAQSLNHPRSTGNR